MIDNNSMKNKTEASVQLPETKLVAEEGGGMVSTTAAKPRANVKANAFYVALRLLCVVTSVTALSLMVTAKQASTISIYGFSLPVYSKWSFSDSFVYLVGVSAVVAVHSVLQLIISASKLLRKSSIIHSRRHAWLIFAADQIFAFALMSAGSAASGVTNLNRTGIRHSSLPNFCKPLRGFCDRVAISIGFTFFTCFLIATLVVLDVIWLSKH